MKTKKVICILIAIAFSLQDEAGDGSAPIVVAVIDGEQHQKRRIHYLGSKVSMTSGGDRDIGSKFVFVVDGGALHCKKI